MMKIKNLIRRIKKEYSPEFKIQDVYIDPDNGYIYKEGSDEFKNLSEEYSDFYTTFPYEEDGIECLDIYIYIM